jgi:hypothetical protein
MLNLAVLSFGQNPVCDDHYFNDAFLGTGPISNSGSFFDVTVCEIMHCGMGPFRDEELVRFLQIAQITGDSRASIGEKGVYLCTLV